LRLFYIKKAQHPTPTHEQYLVRHTLVCLPVMK